MLPDSLKLDVFKSKSEKEWQMAKREEPIAQSLAIISNTEGGGRSVWLMVIVVFWLFVEGVLPVMAH